LFSSKKISKLPHLFVEKISPSFIFNVPVQFLYYTMDINTDTSRINHYRGFPPSTRLILENFALKSISEIKPGDLIYVDSSTIDQVQNVKKYMYRGIIKEIRFTGQVFKIESLENQLYYTIKKEIRDYCRKKYSKINIEVLEENIEIIKCKQLKKGDMLLIPKHEQRKTNVKLRTKDFISTFSNYIRNEIPEFIDFSKELFRWFGYYLAEGMVLFTSDKRYDKKCRGISFTININEKKIAQEIICIGENVFDVKSKLIKIVDRNAYRINFYNTQLGELIYTLFNTGSSKKRIHNFLLSAPIVLLKELINGWLKGDGWICNSKDLIIGNTTSVELANQIYLILINLGELPALGRSAHINQNRIKARELGYYLRHDLYNIRLYKNKNRSHRKQTRNYVFSPILQTDYKFYEGYIYDIEMKNIKSFQANNILVKT